MTTRIDIDRSDGIVWLTMNALPQPSTVDVESCVALTTALRDIAESASDCVVVLRGAGSVFSAGGNLAFIEESLADAARLATLVDRFHETVLALRRLPQPVVACVHGAAAGAGFSLAMACDTVVAARTARFVVGYPKLGTSCDGGLSFQLTRRLGRQRALNVFLLTESLAAGAAQALGLVDRVADDEALASEAEAVARQLAAHPAAAVRELKRLVSGVADEGLERQLDDEKAAFLRCAATPEFDERVRAFNERSHRR